MQTGEIYRVLYLARLKAIELDSESSKDEEAPPIPYGLNNLSDSVDQKVTKE